MNYKILSILFLAFLFISFDGYSQKRTNRVKWERLGRQNVDYTIDKDDMRIGAKQGGFTKLKIVVTGGDLNMHKMIVTYQNGEKEEIELRHDFKEGSGSRIIDLKGGKRLIKEIRFFYDTKNDEKNKAKVTVLARK